MSAYGRQSYYSQQPPPRQQQQQPPQYATNGHTVELLADTSYNQSNQQLQPGNDRFSQTYSELGGSSPQPLNGRWSGVQSERHSSAAGSVHSYPTTAMSAPDGSRSPRTDIYSQSSKNFAVELPSNEVVPPRPPKEELDQNKENQRTSQQGYSYNPQDFVRR
jgi:hypothetical protein